MLNEIRETIRSFGMLQKGDVVIVGVSGGSDSVGLLMILSELEEYDLDIVVAHMNHKLRKEEARRDADYVSELARRYGFRFEYREVDTVEYSRCNRLSFEEAARKLRYDFFYEVLQKHGASRIATAHTINDQAETVLIRMIRGSGTVGLSAILPCSKRVIRPLINTERSEIRNYLRSKNISWVEDSTNLSEVYMRNRVRSELLPLLKSFNPNIDLSLANLASISQIESDYISSQADKIADRIIRGKSFGITGEVIAFKTQHQAIRLTILRKCVEKIKGDLRAVAFKHIMSADQLIVSDRVSGMITLPYDVVIAKGQDYFCVADRGDLIKEYSDKISGPGRWKLSCGLEIQVDVVRRNEDIFSCRDESVGHFSSRALRFPFEVGSFREGERIMPLGMKDFKKLKNLFVDCKVPRFFRKRVPVFRSCGEIFWAGGIRIDERYKVTGSDEEVLRIRIMNPEFIFKDSFRFS